MSDHLNERGDEFWLGPIGPIQVSDDPSPEAQRYAEACRTAQAATSVEDLVDLVLHHKDAMVRQEAVPRLKARFRGCDEALDALLLATTDSDSIVRFLAFSAISDFQRQVVNDVLAVGLNDVDPDVRLVAGQNLLVRGDPRAPADPEAAAYDPMVDR